MINLEQLSSEADYINLFFLNPLYSQYKVDLHSYIVESEENIFDFDEFKTVLTEYIAFFENKDFTTFKKIVTDKMNLYYYCPTCQKDMYLVSEASYLNEKFSNNLFLKKYSHLSDSEKSANLYASDMKTEESYVEFIEEHFDNKITFTRTFICSSPEEHHISIVFRITSDNYLIKIGQYPSIVEFEPTLKLYQKVLSTQDYKEIKKAIGLKSHGNGIGAYTYLRRVFENLIYKRIEEVFEDDSTALGMTLQEMMSQRMQDKIDLLGKKHLPAFMVDNKILYSIISKGIHELTEKECLEYFETLKASVFFILEEEKHKRARDIILKEMSTGLNKIHSALAVRDEK